MTTGSEMGSIVSAVPSGSFSMGVAGVPDPDHYVFVTVIKEEGSGTLDRTDIRTILTPDEAKRLIADMGSKRLERGAGNPNKGFGQLSRLKLPEGANSAGFDDFGASFRSRKGHPPVGWNKNSPSAEHRLGASQDAALKSAKEVQAALLVHRWRGKKKTEYFGVGAPSVLLARAWSRAHTKNANTDTVLKLMRPDTTQQGSVRYIKLHGSVEIPEKAQVLDVRGKTLVQALNLFFEWDEQCS
jgi:hypothetical protein